MQVARGDLCWPRFHREVRLVFRCIANLSRALACVAALLLLGAPVKAQEVKAQEATAQEATLNTAGDAAKASALPGDWKLIVSPYVWALSLDGDASLAGFDTHVDVPFSETLKHLDLAIMGNVEVTNGQFGFYFDGQYAETSQEEELFSNELAVGIATTTLAVGAFYRAYEHELGGRTVFDKPRVFALEPTVGLRWTKLEATVQALGLSATKQATWTDPFVGVRLTADLDERWNLWAEADIGGFDIGSKIAYSAQAFLGYRTFVLDHPTVLRLGYRVTSQDFETEDFTGDTFKWDVTQHGPLIGFSMQF